MTEIRHITHSVAMTSDKRGRPVLKTTLRDQHGVELEPGEAAEGFATLSMTGLCFKVRPGAARAVHSLNLPRYGRLVSVDGDAVTFSDEGTEIENVGAIPGLPTPATPKRYSMHRTDFLKLYELD